MSNLTVERFMKRAQSAGHHAPWVKIMPAEPRSGDWGVDNPGGWIVHCGSHYHGSAPVAAGDTISQALQAGLDALMHRKSKRCRLCPPMSADGSKSEACRIEYDYRAMDWRP